MKSRNYWTVYVQIKRKGFQTPRKAIRKSHIQKAQKAVIYACLANGIEKDGDIEKVLASVRKNFSRVSVAGCKAAITKKQVTFGNNLSCSNLR